MRPSHVRAVVPLLLALSAGTASAATFDVSGFGTAGFVITDTDKAEFGSSSQPVGADSNGDVGVDSIGGVQATVHFTDKLSASTQVLLRRLYDDGFELDVPLAFVKADVTKEFAVRLGRLPLPVFMVSDFRQVGFANTWIRPPVEVYGQVPLDSVDGLDVLLNKNLGELSFNGQAFYGKTNVSLPTVDVSSKKFWGVNVTGTYGPLTLRAARVEDKLTIVSAQANGLIAAVRQAGFASLADDLSTVAKDSSFTAFGAALDWHNIIVQAEHTKAETGGYPSDSIGEYVLAGYRVQKFTPYAIYAKRETSGAQTSNVIPKVGPLLPLAFGVNALMTGQEQDTTSVGLRWDAASSVAVKFQYDYVDPTANGLFLNPKAGFKGPVNVLGIAVDVVY
jgi:hypothetical protein